MNVPRLNGEDAGFVGALTAMVSRAARNLESAKTSAEILEARDRASVAYDASKKAARMATAKGAHDELIAAAHRAQADALEIEATAKRRLADEYDAAQERGEVMGSSRSCVGGDNAPATAADIGLRRDQIHEARKIRDAEKAQPGIVRQTLDRSLSEKREPTRAELQRSVMAAVSLAQRRPARPKNPLYRPDPLFSRVAKFSDLCEQIAQETDSISDIANYETIETTRAKLHRNADAALTALNLFMESRNA